MERTLRRWLSDLGFPGHWPKRGTTLPEFWAEATGPVLAFLLVRMASAEGWPTRGQVVKALADIDQAWAEKLADTQEWGEDEAFDVLTGFEADANDREADDPEGVDGLLTWEAETLRMHVPQPGPMTDPVGDKPWELLARAEQQIVELKSRLAELEAGVSIISEYENRVEPPEGAALTALALLSDGGKPCPDCADGDDPGYLVSLDAEGEPYPHFCPRCGGMAIVAREGA